METKEPKFDKKTGLPLEKPAEKPVEVAPQATFTMSDVMALLNEFKKPNEVEQFRYEQEKKKVDQEQSARLSLAERARHNAQLVMQQQAEKQAGCAHIKENGRTAWAAQVNSDGNARFMCLRCLKVLPPVKAPDEWKTGGVNTQMGPDVAGAMQFITEAHIMAWHRGTMPNCQEPCCKPRAVAV